MAARHHDFGVAQVRPEAHGQPGHRTFQLLLESSAGNAALVLEKQQLSELALAVQHLLELHAPARATAPLPDVAASHVQVEFKIGRIGLDFDVKRQSILALLQDEEATEKDSVNISCWLPRQAAQEFCEAALAVCAAGRPLCPLCHGPIDPEGHRCPKSNGHKVAALEEGSQQI